MKRFQSAAESVGGTALIVDAKDERAADFYRLFGFQPFNSHPLKPFLPLATIIRALADIPV
jgi:hypothetical protein